MARAPDLYVRVHFDFGPGTDSSDTRLDQIIELLQQSKQREQDMATDLTALTAEVTEAAGVQQSAITLIENIAQMLRDAGTDPVALAALADQLDSSTTALAAAVEANQPPVAPPV